MGLLLHNRMGNGFLTSQRINRNNAVLDLQKPKQGRDGRNLVGLLIYPLLSQHHPISTGPRAHHIDSALAGSPIKGAAQRRTLNGHHLSVRQLTHRLYPAQKTALQFFRLEPYKTHPNVSCEGRPWGKAKNCRSHCSLAFP